MKYVYIILIFSIFIVGCGYKTDPVYIENTNGKK